MKLTDLLNIVYDYEDACRSPTRMEVRFGCDCGCGGDSYTIEEWNHAELTASASIRAMKDFCEKYNITYDGIKDDD